MSVIATPRTGIAVRGAYGVALPDALSARAEREAACTDRETFILLFVAVVVAAVAALHSSWVATRGRSIHARRVVWAGVASINIVDETGCC